jgi:hypothetical protein
MSNVTQFSVVLLYAWTVIFHTPNREPHKVNRNNGKNSKQVWLTHSLTHSLTPRVQTAIIPWDRNPVARRHSGKPSRVTFGKAHFLINQKLLLKISSPHLHFELALISRTFSVNQPKKTACSWKTRHYVPPTFR